MKRVEFYAKTNRSGNLLHIETDGCIVNIRVGLTDHEGRAVTSVEIVPEDEGRGGDGEGRYWHLDTRGNRVVRQPALTHVEEGSRCTDDGRPLSGWYEGQDGLYCVAHNIRTEVIA